MFRRSSDAALSDETLNQTVATLHLDSARLSVAQTDGRFDGGEGVQRALAPVGHRAHVDRPSGGLEPATDRGGHLGGGERSLEGVRRHEDGLGHAGDAAH